MKPGENVTVTRRYVHIEAKGWVRVAAGVLAPGALFGAVLCASFDDKPVLWRIVLSGLCLAGGVVFALAAFRPGTKIPMGPATTTRATGDDRTPPR